MLKIMIADDEGIVIEALKFIIENNISKSYMIESAKTGRQAIELVERFRPDIAFMDIQMPGISGIKAMQEIRKHNQDTIFIIVSSFEKFDYAKDAIGIGVLDYLNKPINKEKVIEVLNQAIDLVEENQRKRADELEIQEKLETVLPIIEMGMINAVLFQEDLGDEMENYRNLLGLTCDSGYILILRFGENVHRGKFTNVIGTTVKTQPLYENLKSIVKEYTSGVVGSLMGNNVIVFIPEEMDTNEYDERIRAIDKMREMVRILKQQIGCEFRIGMGSVKPLKELSESYREALEAMRIGDTTVSHVKDLPIGCVFEKDYPAQTEKKIFIAVENGDRMATLEAASSFCDWMEANPDGSMEDIRIKALEFVLMAENIAYNSGGMTYRFLSRHTYLEEVNQARDFAAIKGWFLDKMSTAAENVKAKKKESAHDVIDQARKYIEDKYRDVSLDSISRDLDISPYYFSKLFKEKTGENFIDYLTDYKISKAKEMITKNEMSMKEICVEIGYANPNYFSYIFKKKVGVTPSEYREGLSS